MTGDKGTQGYLLNRYADRDGYWDHFIAVYGVALGYDSIQMTMQPNENGGWMFEIASPQLSGRTKLCDKVDYSCWQKKVPAR